MVVVVVGGGWVGGGLFDFRVTPNPNFMLDVNLDVEFDNYALKLSMQCWLLSSLFSNKLNFPLILADISQLIDHFYSEHGAIILVSVFITLLTTF